MVGGGNQSKKNLDFELNLVSFFDLLSVMICTLLLTAMWEQIGILNVKQSVGGQTQESKIKTPKVWVLMSDAGEVSFEGQDLNATKKSNFKHKISGLNGRLNEAAAVAFIKDFKAQFPEIETALVKPGAETVYEDIIKLMDVFKEVGVINLGVSPI